MLFSELNKQAISSDFPVSRATDMLFEKSKKLTHFFKPEILHSYETLEQLNRKTSESYSGGYGSANVTYALDANGNVEQIDETIDGESFTTTQGFDDLERMTSKTDRYGNSFQFSYDPNGNRKTFKDHENKLTNYTFDGLNRLKKLTHAGVGTFNWSYNIAGLTETIDYPNGASVDYEYDLANRISSIYNKMSGANITEHLYEYDANGNRKKLTETNIHNNQIIDYTYDQADRLTVVEYPNNNKTTYVLDKVGNRTEEIITGTNPNSKTYSYNNRDQLISITDTNGLNTTYSYDEAGNQTEKIENGVTTTFDYSSRGRVKSITVGANPTINYQYDYTGQRVNHQSQGQEKRFLYDGLTLIAETNTIGNTFARYHFGDRYQLAETRNNINSFYHVDSLTTNVAVTNADGSIAARYEYDAYGNLLTQNGSSQQPFGFTGYQKDNDTGLYYANARYYDFQTARFLREDPLFGNPENPPSLHRYNYTANNPTYFVDPTGEGDEAAHFYNEYFDSRAAGLNVMDSLTIGFGAVYPDKIDRYDAKTLYFSLSRINPFGSVTNEYTRKNNSGLHALTNSKIIYTINAVNEFQDNLNQDDHVRDIIYPFALSEHPGKDSIYHIPKNSLFNPNAIGFSEIFGHGAEFHSTDKNYIYPEKEIVSSIYSMNRIYEFGVKTGRIEKDDAAFKERVDNRIKQIRNKQTQLENIYESGHQTTYCSAKEGYCGEKYSKNKDTIEFELLSKMFNEDTDYEFDMLKPENIDVADDFSDILGVLDKKTLRKLNGFSERPDWGEGLSKGLLIDSLDTKFDMSAKYVRDSINNSIIKQIESESATVTESADDSGVKLKYDYGHID